MGLDRLIDVSWVCVCVLCVEPVIEVERGRERNKNDGWKAQENGTEKRLERNNKERLKNNILIKIEFWDAGGIVKWYGIMIKWLFRMLK